MKMKRYLFALTLALHMCLASACLFATQETLNNSSIISLVDAKIAKGLIIDKIRSASAGYDLSGAGLVTLRRAKVADVIVEEMMKVTKKLTAVGNDEVIEMVMGDVAKGLIIKRIILSESRFDMSTDAMITLKNSKVPDSVVAVMMDRSRMASADQKAVR